MLVIANSWHDSNKGDAAILEGIVTQLRESCGFAGQLALIPSVDLASNLSEGMLRHNARQTDIDVRPHLCRLFPGVSLNGSGESLVPF